jgi:hypothetical protein
MAQEVVMGKINWTKVFFGGLVWAVVYVVLGSAAMYLFLQRELSAEFEALGRSIHLTTGLIVYSLVLSVLAGISALWFYAAIRPRYGPGPKTAAIAAFALWLFGGLAPMSALIAIGMASTRFAAIDLSTGLVIMVVATLIGAWQYTE